MGRRTDRRHAFNLIFQLGFSDGSAGIDKVFDEYVENHMGKGVDKEFIYLKFSGAFQNLESIDEIIEKHLKSWTTSRLNKADLAILRLAVYEMYYNDEIPGSIAINEAVELAKLYSEEDSPGFINAVLGDIIKSMDGDKS